jgi:hypothetical protein
LDVGLKLNADIIPTNKFPISRALNATRAYNSAKIIDKFLQRISIKPQGSKNYSLLNSFVKNCRQCLVAYHINIV